MEESMSERTLIARLEEENGEMMREMEMLKQQQVMMCNCSSLIIKLYKVYLTRRKRVNCIEAMRFCMNFPKSPIICYFSGTGKYGRTAEWLA